MQLDGSKIPTYPDEYIGAAFEPPCGITNVVRFVNGVCPFSGHKDCHDCITNEFDAECMWVLINANKFGLA